MLVLVAELFAAASGAASPARSRCWPAGWLVLCVGARGRSRRCRRRCGSCACRCCSALGALSRWSASARWLAGRSAHERRARRGRCSPLGLGVIVVRRRSIAIALVARAVARARRRRARRSPASVGELLDRRRRAARQGGRAAGAAARRSCAARASRGWSRRRAGAARAARRRAAPWRWLPSRSCRRSGSATRTTEHTAVALVLARDRDRRRAPAGVLPGARACSSPRTACLCWRVSVPGGLPVRDRARARCSTSSLVVAVAAAFTPTIHDELGTGDTELLRGLRD